MCRRDHQAALVRRSVQGDDHLDRSSRDALSVGATATSIAFQQETTCSKVQRRSNTRRSPTLVCKAVFRTTDASDAYTCRAQKHKCPYRGALRQSVQQQLLDFGMKSRLGSIKRFARVGRSLRPRPRATTLQQHRGCMPRAFWIGLHARLVVLLLFVRVATAPRYYVGTSGQPSSGRVRPLSAQIIWTSTPNSYRRRTDTKAPPPSPPLHNNLFIDTAREAQRFVLPPPAPPSPPTLLRAPAPVPRIARRTPSADGSSPSV